ncbi:aldehyde dehydrogenase (NADP(+)) [Pelagicoccus sp. SDUM812003]|uniref:aldehyde dehydrogenase (NADP(+)) n=1 Tax=Pelagicoccus sp. SDUM812003 TaxID=3041267 RepID=UPI00280E0877|nr:aldehyde dehydrogenase (NADP(+)) [Pelagicoccus sp. SDUM812003]MDQ8201940.1 aldehyde dehydrogenase (NADP(+)) [Pelagicoccus sp. SDUM812003]
MQNLLVNGQWLAAKKPEDSFHARNPSDRSTLSEREFPVSSWQDIEAMIGHASEAARVLAKTPTEAIASFLDEYARLIETRTEELAKTAHLETGLPVRPRLAEVEIPRTVNQLRQAAAAARAGDWARPTIDTTANIRSVHGPLGGPVVVFGPNNFPFAYNGIAGGDFAAAIAAGNPVIAKSHPAHPHTTELLAQLANQAVKTAGLPQATVQLFYHVAPENGKRLVSHPDVAAAAFTGSRTGGLALKEAADKAGTPIYLEMSSVNPVFVLPGSLQERGSEIADELHGSCNLGAGQFCTKPGLVILPSGAKTDEFIQQLKNKFQQTAPGVLLTEGGEKTVAETVGKLVDSGAEILAGGEPASQTHFGYRSTLLRVSGSQFLKNPEQLQSEAFGAVCLLVAAESLKQMQAIVTVLEGNLTGCIYSSKSSTDDEAYQAIASELRFKVGRLLNDKVPTGVAVSPAMNHGGPYPSTGHPGFTAVGFPATVIRFSALHSYDNVRHERLPLALQDKNPTGKLLRYIDGAWSTKDL